MMEITDEDIPQSRILTEEEDREMKGTSPRGTSV